MPVLAEPEELLIKGGQDDIAFSEAFMWTKSHNKN